MADIERFSQAAIVVASYVDDLFLAVGAKAPPQVADTSPFAPLISNLAQVVAGFSAGTGPTSVPDFQQNAVALMETAGRIYGNESKQYREFGEWLKGLREALGAAARNKEEQATAQLTDFNERTRLAEENRALRQQVEEIRAKFGRRQKGDAATKRRHDQ